MSRKLKVVDLFAGVGGLSYGFSHDPRFEILAANEILPDIAKAYSLNHPEVKMYATDIAEFSGKVFSADFSMNPKEVDLVIGGPPCQAYSTSGKRLLDDPRAHLFREYHRILKDFEPKFFIFENVSGLQSMNHGRLLPEIRELFGSLGYEIQVQLLNAADYGAPQIRERVILTGSRMPRQFIYPAPTHADPRDIPPGNSSGLLPHLTLGEAISDLPLIRGGEESEHYASQSQNDFQREMRKNAPDKLMDHNASLNNPNLVALMEALPEGGLPKDLPPHLRPKSGFPNSYARLWWDKPCTTITRNLGTPSSARCIHPKVARALTTREGARLQCFPDSYQFYGSRSSRNLQIGNAVATFLSQALAQSVGDYFDPRSTFDLPQELRLSLNPSTSQLRFREMGE